jgi:di/tricarboxylate transporter
VSAFSRRRLDGTDDDRGRKGERQAAKDVDVSARPVLKCVTVSAAAALLTPVATPANLMVMEPGGYRFGDYWKLGLPLLALYGIVAVLLVPVFWRF